MNDDGSEESNSFDGDGDGSDFLFLVDDEASSTPSETISCAADRTCSC